MQKQTRFIPERGVIPNLISSTNGDILITKSR